MKRGTERTRAHGQDITSSIAALYMLSLMLIPNSGDIRAKRRAERHTRGV